MNGVGHERGQTPTAGVGGTVGSDPVCAYPSPQGGGGVRTTASLTARWFPRRALF